MPYEYAQTKAYIEKQLTYAGHPNAIFSEDAIDVYKRQRESRTGESQTHGAERVLSAVEGRRMERGELPGV